jgi:RimJ/RimL family protein N-acetyltransferase
VRDGGPEAALEGSLVRLRAHETSDYGPLNELFIDPGVLEGVGFAMPQSRQAYREFVESARGKEERIVFVIERLEDRQAMGGCSLEAIEARNRAAILGIWIGKPYWHRGYGTDAMRTLCRFGFRHLNLQRIELNVFSVNPRALRVYERVGFKIEGTRRRSQFVGGLYVDSYVMGLLSEELAG